MAYVYELIDPRNNRVFYVGKGTDRRAYRHISKVKCGKTTENPYKDALIKQILSDGFEPIVNIVQDNLNDDIALDLEKSLIESYGRSFNNSGCLTNLSEGGLQPPIKKGIDHPNYGKTFDEIYGEEKATAIRLKMSNRTLSMESKQIISEKAIKRCKNPEYIEMMSVVHKGIKRSEESKKNQSKTNTGDGNPMFGKNHTKESRQKISINHHIVSGTNNPRAQTYELKDPNGIIYTVTGALEKFCKENRFDLSTVIKYCKSGNIPTKGKFAGWSIRKK